MPATTTPTPHDEERVTFTPPAVELDGPRPNLRVVTVFSAKGGAGATVVATNLALAMAETGARVCLLDLAVAFGDVAVSLQLAPRRSLVDALEVGTTNDSVTELVTVHPSGLHCVLSPVDPTGVERMPTDVVRRLIGALRSAYDVVVIDTASELSEHVLEAIDASDRLLLVTTPEIPAVKNTRIALDMLDLVGHPREQSHVVLNLFDPLFGLTVQDVRIARSSSTRRCACSSTTRCGRR